MPGCSVSLTTESFCSVVNRRRWATPVMTSTFENVSDIGVCLGLCLAPPANAGVRSERGAVQSGFYLGGGIGFLASNTNETLDLESVGGAPLQTPAQVTRGLATSEPLNGLAFRGTVYAG